MTYKEKLQKKRDRNLLSFIQRIYEDINAGKRLSTRKLCARYRVAPSIIPALIRSDVIRRIENGVYSYERKSPPDIELVEKVKAAQRSYEKRSRRCSNVVAPIASLHKRIRK